MKLFAVCLFVSGLLALNAAHSSQEWQRYKNAYGCEIVPRVGRKPRSYLCQGQSCASPYDCHVQKEKP